MRAATRITLSRRAASLVMCLGVVLLVGCELLGADSRGLRIETSTEQFVVGQDTSFVVTVENVGDHVVYYSGCLDVRLEKVRGPHVVESAAPVRCRCICTTELKPGEGVEFDVGTWLDDVVLEVYHEAEASYRLRFSFHRDEAMQRPLPGAALVSNRFHVTSALRAWTEAGSLRLENRLDRPLAYVALEAEAATLIYLSPPSEWPNLGASEEVAISYDSLKGYDPGDDQAIVYWSDEEDLSSYFWIDID